MTSGDTIIHEYKGDVYSDRFNTGFATQRFYDSSFRLRTFTLRNTGATYNLYIGKYTSSGTAFLADAMTIKPGYTKSMEFVDLYNLGHYSGGVGSGPTSVEVIGTY